MILRALECIIEEMRSVEIFLEQIEKIPPTIIFRFTMEFRIVARTNSAVHRGAVGYRKYSRMKMESNRILQISILFHEIRLKLAFRLHFGAGENNVMIGTITYCVCASSPTNPIKIKVG